MAYITCPSCGRAGISDTASSCDICLCNFAIFYRKQEEERKKRDAEELEARRLADANTGSGWGIPTPVLIILGLIAFGIFAGISSQNQSVAAGTSLFSIDRQSTNLTPDQQLTFNASGKVKIDYSCSGKSGSVTFKMFASSVDTSGSPIWQQQVKCPAGKSDTITDVPSISYYMDIREQGNATWSVQVTQE